MGTRTVYNTLVHSAKWDEQNHKYTVTLHDGNTNEFRETTEADMMIYAIGGFQGAKFPQDLPGVDKFKGDVFHSANWRHDVELKQKRVGVIGNGCSA